MDEFTQFINTEQGLHFLLQFAGAVTAFVLGILFICQMIETCVLDPMMSGIRWLYTRTKFYKKKHEGFLVIYGSCRELLQDLYMTGHFESKKNEFRFLIKSLDEYKDRHAKEG